MFFIQRGAQFHLTNEASIVSHTHGLPLGNYDVHHDPRNGYYLTVSNDKRGMPAKIYGTVQARAERVLKSYRERSTLGLGTGVLLSGEKGSGKTLLARKIIELAKLPTITVSDPFTETDFLDLLVYGGPKLVLFDEFDKVYRKDEDQEALLTMLDGKYPNTNLTIATMNQISRIVSPMKNRPSRFYYHFRYNSIEKEFVEQYCKDMLHEFTVERFQGVVDALTNIFNFNFDMLQCLVEEMNRFGDTADACLKYLNIDSDGEQYQFLIEAHRPDGTPIRIDRSLLNVSSSNPHVFNTYAQIHESSLTAEEKEDGDTELSIHSGIFTGVQQGKLVYRTPGGIRIVLTPIYSRHFWAL